MIIVRHLILLLGFIYLIETETGSCVKTSIKSPYNWPYLRRANSDISGFRSPIFPFFHSRSVGPAELWTLPRVRLTNAPRGAQSSPDLVAGLWSRDRSEETIDSVILPPPPPPANYLAAKLMDCYRTHFDFVHVTCLTTMPCACGGVIRERWVAYVVDVVGNRLGISNDEPVAWDVIIEIKISRPSSTRGC